MPISWVVLSRSRHHKHKEQHMPRFQNSGEATLERADWHPDYSECCDYRCGFCSATLGEEDNDEDACDTGPSWSDA